MAQVDFSNAVLDVYNGRKPMTSASYLSLGGNANPFINENGVSVTSGSISPQIISNTPTKASILFVGSFTASGDRFLLGYSGGYMWRVSNISFSNGDTFSFIIDIETSGNT